MTTWKDFRRYAGNVLFGEKSYRFVTITNVNPTSIETNDFYVVAALTQDSNLFKGWMIYDDDAGVITERMLGTGSVAGGTATVNIIGPNLNPVTDFVDTESEWWKLPAGWTVKNGLQRRMNDCLRHLPIMDSIPLTLVPDGDMREATPAPWSAFAGTIDKVIIDDNIYSPVVFGNTQALEISGNGTAKSAKFYVSGGSNIRLWMPFFILSGSSGGFEVSLDPEGVSNDLVLATVSDHQGYGLLDVIQLVNYTGNEFVRLKIVNNSPTVGIYISMAVLWQPTLGLMPVPSYIRNTNAIRNLFTYRGLNYPGSTNILNPFSLRKEYILGGTARTNGLHNTPGFVELHNSNGPVFMEVERRYLDQSMTEYVNDTETFNVDLRWATAALGYEIYKLLSKNEGGIDSLDPSIQANLKRAMDELEDINFNMEPDYDPVPVPFMTGGSWGPR